MLVFVLYCVDISVFCYRKVFAYDQTHAMLKTKHKGQFYLQKLILPIHRHSAMLAYRNNKIISIPKHTITRVFSLCYTHLYCIYIYIYIFEFQVEIYTFYYVVLLRITTKVRILRFSVASEEYIVLLYFYFIIFCSFFLFC